MMWGGFGTGWSAIIGMLMMVTVWGGLILLIVWGIRALSAGGTASRSVTAAPPTGDAVEIVKRRYARGEISKDEYEDIRRTLER